MGFGNELLSQLPKIALMAMAARSGGREGYAGLMQGFQQQEQREQELARQAEQDARAATQDARAAEVQRAQLENYRLDNERATQAQEMDRLNRAWALIQNVYAQQAETATDPAAADAVMQQQAAGAAHAFGLPADRLRTFVPSLAPVISNRQKKQAAEIYARAEKRFNPKGENPAWETSITLQTQFGDKTPAQLREMFDTPAVDATGAPAMPPMPPAPKVSEGASDLDRSFQRERIAMEAKLGRPLNPQEIADLDAKVRTEIRTINQPAAADPNGLKPMQEFTISERLAKAWGDATKSKREMQRQLTLMETGLGRFRQGDKNGGSQAVLVTFQKILDPTSVVRESEYARTTDGQSLMNRMEGYITKLEQGGTTLTDKELAAMVGTAQQFLQNMDAHSRGQRRRIEAQVKKYQIDPATVFDDVLLGGDGAPAPTSGSAPIKVGKYTVTVQ